ncbi:claudin-5b [Denticeps clupeoides]|uniref:Claudin n=1 Tax=Denticeps clupeoides TaxID=299321 RepID=A0AAY4B6M3_9TELE|nr:claudin-5-like [Denticeps clupeoides]XP_028827260.1 claudin-5-like [Denticeps clupeoides]
MISACLEFLGMGLSVAGTLMVMVACGLPMWKVSAFIDSNIVVAQTTWEGLWMSCVVQSTGQMQCKVHDSVLALATDLQTARALTVISSLVGVVGLAVTVAGAQCTNCIRADAVKAKVVNAGGVMSILSGLFVLVPLCWMANNIISDFYSQHVPAPQKREIGAALYVGWAAAALLLVGGSVLCCSSPHLISRTPYPLKYGASKCPSQSGGYDKQNYV